MSLWFLFGYALELEPDLMVCQNLSALEHEKNCMRGRLGKGGFPRTRDNIVSKESGTHLFPMGSKYDLWLRMTCS